MSKKEVSRGLSSVDLSNLLGGKVRILTYKQLRKFNNIYDVLKPFGKAILLYETSKNWGHWVCLFKDPKSRVIEHFDSYGIRPDDEIKFVPQYFRKEGGADLPHLTALLYKSGAPIRYNHYKLQSKRKGVSTCGRWCVLRLIFRDLDEHQFKKLFDGKGDKDVYVTNLTENLQK